MFGFLFGWRKASKCKKLIKQLQCRLKLLKNKRNSIVRLLREDVAELVKIGHEESAFNRADQLFKDENSMAVYELLDNFCEFIRINLTYIRKRKDIPNDINEAVSTLIFASSRCGELPELRGIRKLFEQRYGQRFAEGSAQLLPGNLVNCQIIEKLSINSVPDDVKFQLVDEIAKDYCLQPELLALEYASELQQEQQNTLNLELEKDVYTCYSISEGCQRQSSNANKVQDIYADSLLTSTNSTGLNQSRFHSLQNSSAISTLFSSSIVQNSSPDASDSLMFDEAKKVEDLAQFDSKNGFTVAGDHTREIWISGRINAATPVHHKDRITAASSSESLPLVHEEKVVYLDDVQEFQSATRKAGDCQDQRLFKFKQSALPKTDTVDDCNESFVDEYDSWNEKSSSRSSRKSVKASGKQLRRRSLSRENSGMKDIECQIYYEKPRKSSSSKHRSHHHQERQKKHAIEERKQSCYAHKRAKHGCCTESGSNFQSCNCKYGMRSYCQNHFCSLMNDHSMEHSCYSYIDDDEKEGEVRFYKLQIGIKKPVSHQISYLKCENLCDRFDHRHSFQNIESVEDIKKPTLPQKPRRKSYDNGATEYNVFTYLDRWPNEHIQRANGKVKESDSPRRCPAFNSLCLEEAASLTGKKPKAPYLTVKTMPPQRTKDSCTENMLRCKSFPCEYPDHVHPKLPDYDDIAAKFMALKKERLQNKH